jgi:hypothetical protein
MGGADNLTLITREIELSVNREISRDNRSGNASQTGHPLLAADGPVLEQRRDEVEDRFRGFVEVTVDVDDSGSL